MMRVGIASYFCVASTESALDYCLHAFLGFIYSFSQPHPFINVISVNVCQD